MKAPTRGRRSGLPVLISAAVMAMVTLTIGGCNSGSGSGASSGSNAGGVSLVQVEISPANPSIANGTAINLTVTGIYSDHTRQDLTSQATWQSSDPAVAAIANAGGSTVTAESKAAGSTTITATVSGVSATTTLTVTNAALVAIDVSPAAPSVAGGTSVQLTATGRYSDGTAQDLTSQVTWQSSSTGVATVNAANGLVTAVAAGAATVSATMGVVTGSTTVTVTNAALASILVGPPHSAIANGTSTQLYATGVFTDGSTQDLTALVTWSSSVGTVAKVSNVSGSAGLVTALATGAATISATYNGFTGSTTLTVTPAVLTQIDITPATGIVSKGTDLQLSAVGIFNDGTSQDVTNQVTWTSSNQSVAIVANAAGSQGLVTAVAAGSTDISATLSGIAASLTLRVSNAALVSINVSPVSPTLAAGTALALTATGNFSDGSTQDLTQQVSWGTSDASVAQVSNGQGTAGTVTALSQGTAILSATLGQIAGTARLKVTSATLSSIEVTPADPAVAAGRQVALQAIGHFSDNSQQDLTDQVSWRSTDNAVAVISNNAGTQGLLDALTKGSATVTAQYETVSGSTTVTVTDAVLSTIQVSPAGPSLTKGTTVQLTAVGTFSDNSQEDLTSQVVWTSSDDAVASVSNTSAASGLVTGTGGGQATITASLGSIQGTTTVSVTVDPNSPVSLGAVASPNVILDNGSDSSTITVTVEPADPAGAVADGTQVDFRVTQGSAMLSATSAVTTNGVATVTVTSVTAGTFTVTATVHGTSVSNYAPVYATADLSDALGKVAFALANVQSGTVKAGSLFGLYIFNFSNRAFDLIQYQMTDGTGLNNVVKTVTDPASLNDGHLPAVQGTGIVLQLSQDWPDNGFQAAYSLTDPISGTPFGISAQYVLQ